MAQATATRANTLDGLLDELPDFSNDGYFSYPVDDFFHNYVEELGNRGLEEKTSLERAQAALANLDSTNGEFRSFEPQNLGTTGQNYTQNLGSNNQTFTQQQQNFGESMPAAMSLDLDSMLPASTYAQNGQMIPTSNDAAAGMQNGSAYTNFDNQSGMEMPFIDAPLEENGRPASENSGSGVQDMRNISPRQNRGRAPRTRASLDYHLDSGENMDSDEGGRTGRANGKTKRNAKQQAQNKQAQQRYRERRKQRFNDMEHAIDGLTRKLEQMQAVQSQNAMLQAKRDELEAMLTSKDQELDRLRGQVQNGAESKDEPSLEQRRKVQEAHVQDLRNEALTLVRKLKDFIAEHHLQNVNPTGEGADPQVVQKLAEMVGRGCSSCQSAMRAEGVDLLRLMSSDVKQLSRIQCMRKCDVINKVLETLKLTALQKDQLLLLRNNHLQNLRRVYESRNKLNMKAMALMLPNGGSAEVQGLDGQMACMSIAGYRTCAAHNIDFDEILVEIRDNLRLEQKFVMEMNFCTMHRIMSPIQAALFLVSIYPSWCDALELANALAQQAGLKSSSGDLNGQAGSQDHSEASPTSSTCKEKAEKCIGHLGNEEYTSKS